MGNSMMDIRRRVVMSQPHLVTPASAGVVTFNTDMRAPLKELKVNIEPVQDLHGYDSPWPAGGGVNKWPVSDMSFTLYSTSLNKTDYPEIYAAVEKLTPGANYRCWSTGTGENVLVAINLYYSDRTIAIRPTNMTGGKIPDLSDGTITLNSVQMQVGTATNISKECHEIRVIETTTSNPAYVPYENICPISGFDSVKLMRTGKNIASILELLPTYHDQTQWGITSTKNDSGIQYSGTATASGKKFFELLGTYSQRSVDIEAGVSYTISYNQTGGFNLQGQIMDENGQTVLTQYGAWLVPEDYVDSASGRHYYTFTANATGRLSFMACCSLESGVTYDGSIYDIQLEISSEPTDYESYQGETYEVTFPSEAGTVYGGSLTVNKDGTGTLVVDTISAELTGTAVGSRWEDADRDSMGFYTNADWWIYNTGLPAPVENGGLFSYCYNANVYNTNNWWAANLLFTSGRFNRFEIRIPKNALPTIDVAGAKQYLNEHPLQVVYKIAPQTYTLTASQVRTLLGTNHVWSDAGDIELSYWTHTP